MTLKVRKLQSGWGSAAPSQTPLSGVGVSHYAITFPLHLNPGSAPDLAKHKGTPLVSLYPLPNARVSSCMGLAKLEGDSPPPPPPPPSIRIWPNARDEWFWGWGGGGAISAFCPRRPTPSLRHCYPVIVHLKTTSRLICRFFYKLNASDVEGS